MCVYLLMCLKVSEIKVYCNTDLILLTSTLHHLYLGRLKTGVELEILSDPTMNTLIDESMIG